MNYPIFYQARVGVRPGLNYPIPFSKPRYVAELLVSVDRSAIEQEFRDKEWKDDQVVSMGEKAALNACGEVVDQRAKATADEVLEFLNTPRHVPVPADVLEASPIVAQKNGIVVRLIGETTA